MSTKVNLKNQCESWEKSGILQKPFLLFPPQRRQIFPSLSKVRMCNSTRWIWLQVHLSKNTWHNFKGGTHHILVRIVIMNIGTGICPQLILSIGFHYSNRNGIWRSQNPMFILFSWRAYPRTWWCNQDEAQNQRNDGNSMERWAFHLQVSEE